MSTTTDEPTTAIATRVSPLDAFERDVLACGPDVAPEQLLAVLDLADATAARLKEIRKTLEELAITWVKEHGPIFITKDQFYYVSRDKKAPKCVNVRDTMDAILKACGGDVDAVCEHLSAGAIKYGAAKQTLSATDYKRLFVIDEVDRLKPSAELEKLQKCDKRFVR